MHQQQQKNAIDTAKYICSIRCYKKKKKNLKLHLVCSFKNGNGWKKKKKQKLNMTCVQRDYNSMET